jgi:hypothetical protein
MKEDIVKKDDFLKELLAKEDLPTLSENFTLKLMVAVEQEAASRARIYQPLISRTGWQRIALALAGLVVLQLIVLILFPWITANSTPALPAYNYFPQKLIVHLQALPQLLTAGAICVGLWLLEKAQKNFWRHKNSF